MTSGKSFKPKWRRSKSLKALRGRKARGDWTGDKETPVFPVRLDHPDGRENRECQDLRGQRLRLRRR